MLIAKEDDIGKAPTAIIPPIGPEEPEEPEWGGRTELPHYIEVGKVPIVIDVSLLTWAQTVETRDRSVAVTHFPLMNDTIVSTVFLGLDHRFGFYGPPQLYETMVFCGWEEHKAIEITPDMSPRDVEMAVNHNEFFAGRKFRPDVYCRRYATRQQAMYGHMVLCATKGWLREERDEDDGEEATEEEG